MAGSSDFLTTYLKDLQRFYSDKYLAKIFEGHGGSSHRYPQNVSLTSTILNKNLSKSSLSLIYHREQTTQSFKFTKLYFPLAEERNKWKMFSHTPLGPQGPRVCFFESHAQCLSVAVLLSAIADVYF